MTTTTMDIIVRLKLPNQRAYDVACAIANLKGYKTLDDFVNDVFLDRLQMYHIFNVARY